MLLSYNISKSDNQYKCTDCKTLTKRLPVTLSNKCLVCWNVELEASYKKEKYTYYFQNELKKEHRILKKKKQPRGIQQGSM